MVARFVTEVLDGSTELVDENREVGFSLSDVASELSEARQQLRLCEREKLPWLVSNRRNGAVSLSYQLFDFSENPERLAVEIREALSDGRLEGISVLESADAHRALRTSLEEFIAFRALSLFGNRALNRTELRFVRRLLGHVRNGNRARLADQDGDGGGAGGSEGSGGSGGSGGSSGSGRRGRSNVRVHTMSAGLRVHTCGAFFKTNFPTFFGAYTSPVDGNLIPGSYCFAVDGNSYLYPDYDMAVFAIPGPDPRLNK